ncbi:MAG: pilus assembly protein PilP [Gammaproteobacteria bacterium]|nr:pilus assembly protein PilP [Gammaproteobacteria bacterium]MCZ6717241.1 pilus assembly protein PilP [Gammaproteobacteria bacterium]MCZ6827428.1 pilus assembly protein PilP [Gammaproteobacteria bacterium]MCZ6913041.1 pilus assembly protein PilP [Pseudomonadota bacterium]
MNTGKRTGFMLMAIAACGLLAGCTGGTDDLTDYVAEVKLRDRKDRIKPLPQIKPYDTFVYEADAERSPFMPDTPSVVVRNASGSAISPDDTRSREFLEQFPLDSMNMVGTLELSGTMYGLLQTSDSLVHRVVIGDYIGQNDGQIKAITDIEIELLEIISDGLGGYIERPAAVALSD